ncbi:hypothetical protein KC19_4G132400 [Ceratodon purpureus]|uniref:Secreted protein n=1 Tax=Ceratodon purpureus TaxID=3225 RepID=A0A8T0IA67_CERPU|nr:hypothetical protein KC19_4G132400 [Ceratodon purpureus]
MDGFIWCTLMTWIASSSLVGIKSPAQLPHITIFNSRKHTPIDALEEKSGELGACALQYFDQITSSRFSRCWCYCDSGDRCSLLW